MLVVVVVVVVVVVLYCIIAPYYIFPAHEVRNAFELPHSHTIYHDPIFPAHEIDDASVYI